MAKVKLTKNELKKQKDDLKRFTRYLPTLELKKKQLLQELIKIQHHLESLDERIRAADEEISGWAAVFAEPFDLTPYVEVREVIEEDGNIAGCDIPVLGAIHFEEVEYDFLTTPLWIDRGIAAVRDQVRRLIERKIVERQRDIVREEVRITVQRINLFEKVKIPQARESIRVINIFMGDQQTAAVVRGKIAKAKIEKKKRLQEAAG